MMSKYLFIVLVLSVSAVSNEAALYKKSNDLAHIRGILLGESYKSNAYLLRGGSDKDRYDLRGDHYFSVPEGEYGFYFDDKVIPVFVKKGGYFTIVYGRSKPRLFIDKYVDVRRRSHLMVYSLSARKDVSLVVDKYEKELFGRINFGDQYDMEINSLTIGLKPLDSDGTHGSVEELVMTRGQSYSVFFYDETDALRLKVINNRVKQ